MKISILGGSGFVGTNLSQLFSEKNMSFEIFDLKKSEFFPENSIVGNICSPVDLEKISKPRILINLAAVHRDDVSPKSLYDEVNIYGSKNICDYAKKNEINHIIFTSSVAIYGFADPDTDENGEINYFNDYGRTKYLAEQEYIKWYQENPVERSLTIIRPTVIFGEGNRGNVYNLLKQIRSKKFVMFGNGKNEKSMAYIKNLVAFIDYSINFEQGIHIYNYIDKPDMSMNDLVLFVRKKLFNKNNIGLRLPRSLGLFIGLVADLFSKIININLPVSHIRVKKFLSTTKFSSSINNTSFIAPHSLEDGLEKTIRYEFLENNKDKITFETE